MFIKLSYKILRSMHDRSIMNRRDATRRLRPDGDRSPRRRVDAGVRVVEHVFRVDEKVMQRCVSRMFVAT
uniref:Uncharacterized protein n=2 Tax=Chrysodeixis includens nucleopolyhedrovirus TaxID=1207438 RepID=A0A1C8ZYY0_9ABAC|nr:hypothetical protein [Chrysodeixis includens nucleopolyhedrovirus]QGW49186.1 hypothetical protein [Chrysodeixis includens nucleopolyhedrovirus]QGW49326.1 hypothetical protein [Chrysodeixis includens nucleopolyhedrovirus]QGW49466.1 hypothetical protein [Chrysodeixis includens nucleopolyhedrovirus]QGW49606.1 hypothetical protein [Chrysodeixis includens nucleopolyhedrovirus]